MKPNNIGETKTKLKKPFNFKYGSANILIFKRHSNIFLVLRDMDHRHVATLTAGNCKLGDSKKKKMSPLNWHLIILKLKEIMTEKKITQLKFYVYQRIISFIYKMANLLKHYNIEIFNYIYILKVPHGIVRGRNPRRI